MARIPLLKNLHKLLKISMSQLQDSPLNSDRVERPKRKLDRRDFLQTSLLGLGIPNLLWAEQNQSSIDSSLKAKFSSQRNLITVVGGGTAGLSSAYYLAKAGHPCRLFEASSRLGGRMHTMPHFNAESMFCELGGEFVDSQHEDLLNLCLELGLRVENLAANDQFALREFYYSHGKLRSATEILEAFKPLSKRLAVDIKTISPNGDLKVPTYNSELALSPRVQALDRMSLKQYLDESGLDTWLRDLLSSAYVGEYGLEATDQSALNLIVLISAETSAGFKIFGSSDETKRIAGGSEQLPKALAKALQSHCPIEFENRLLAIKDQGQNLILTFDHQGKTIEVRSPRVILAMPASMLKDVDMSSLELSPVKRRAIADWGFGTNSKFIQGFQSRVWEKSSIPRGFSIMPDVLVQEFWDTSRSQHGKSGIITSFLGGKSGQTIDPSLGPKTLAFLDKIIPGTQAAFDGKKILQHWPSQAFTRGSYSCPRPGQYTSIVGAFAEPELQGRLLFAGEHCSSEWSGFMNGAVQSGRQAAVQIHKI